MPDNSNKKRYNDSKQSLRALLAVVMLALLAILAIPTTGQTQSHVQIKPTIPTANRYERGRLFLEGADRLYKPGAWVDYQILTGNVRFRRGDMYMYCDSAHFYDGEGAVQAFGNIKMEQGDTLFVYADMLEYNDSTQLAVLYANPGKKVRLINRDVELRTDVFNYDMKIELGYYEVGGQLTDRQNRLTSVYGEYDPNSKVAGFRHKVHLTSRSKGDTLNIYTEALQYNTTTHIAELSEPSTIINRDGTIYTNQGTYNTETTIADLLDRSTVVTTTGKTLTGDTIFYNRKLGVGRAWGDIILNDTVNKSMITGDYGFYNELTDSAVVTGHALAVDYSSADTLSLHGDTIRAYRVITISEVPVKPIAAINDSTATAEATTEAPVAADKPAAADSVVTVEVADTTHHIVAFPNVRFFRRDLQGVCDSMTFVQKDSLLHMNGSPVVWSDQRQIFGDIITVHMNDSTADRVHLPKNAFTAELLGEEYFNQIAGREMTAYLSAGTLRHIDLSGNVQIIFFPMEQDSTYNKMARAESSFLSADFNEKTLERLKMWPESSETITPLFLTRRSMYYLPDFKWLPERRPKGHDDLVEPRRKEETSDSGEETTTEETATEDTEPATQNENDIPPID